MSLRTIITKNRVKGTLAGLAVFTVSVLTFFFISSALQDQENSRQDLASQDRDNTTQNLASFTINEVGDITYYQNANGVVLYGTPSDEDGTVYYTTVDLWAADELGFIVDDVEFAQQGGSDQAGNATASSRVLYRGTGYEYIDAFNALDDGSLVDSDEVKVNLYELVKSLATEQLRQASPIPINSSGTPDLLPYVGGALYGSIALDIPNTTTAG